MMRMMKVQMESVKRMEELFPPDITLLQIYDSISLGFLRSIASPAGMKLLDASARELGFDVWCGYSEARQENDKKDN